LNADLRQSQSVSFPDWPQDCARTAVAAQVRGEIFEHVLVDLVAQLTGQAEEVRFKPTACSAEVVRVSA